MRECPAFREQHYTCAAPTSPYRLLSAPPQSPVDSDEFASRMGQVGRAYRSAGVGEMVLVHGTFVGDDLLELAPLLEPWRPRWADYVRRTNKRLIDRCFGDAGNFSPEYAATLERALSADGGGPPISVRRFLWSGGNCHLSRAVAAVRLSDELAMLPAPACDAAGSSGATTAPRRILCLGHSHGANVLALLSGLLGAGAAERRRFVRIVAPAVPRPRGGSPYYDAWQRACRRLESDEQTANLLTRRRLDVVTLGVPNLYGWHPAGHDRLLHFVNHRPAPRLPPYRTRTAGSPGDLLRGRDGDYVQQLGIAGSDFPWPPWRWRSAAIERLLGKLLAPGIGFHGIRRRLRIGMRVADAGTALLVDYGTAQFGSGLRHLAGHGVYTHLDRMLFHAEQIARELYSLQ